MVPRSRNRIVVALVIALLHLAALLAFAPITGLPLDDAWIHQVVARTFAETGTLGYSPGQHGAATTSQLWSLLLAVNHRFLGIDPVRWAFALNAAASLATSQLLHVLLLRGRTPERATDNQWMIASAFAALLACISGNVLWFAHSGMEACLFVMLSLAAIVLVTRPTPFRTQDAVIGGFAAGLVALTRPEAIPLGALLVAYVTWRRQQPRRSRALALAPLLVFAPWMLGVALYLGFNLGLTGVALPATRAGRSWLWLSSYSGLSSLDLVASFFETWGSRLAHYTFATKSFGLWIGVGVAAYGVVRLVKLRNDGIKLLFVWAILHIGVYVVLLPTPGHGGRYQPLLPMLYAMSVAIGTIFLVADLVYRVGRTKEIVVRHLVPIGCVLALPWALFAMPAWRDSSNAHVLAMDHIRDTEIETGRWLDVSLPKDARIASFDIGGIGFASRRSILDIGGLSDAASAHRLGDGSVWELLAAHNITHVVLPSSYHKNEGHLGEPLDFGARLHLTDNPAIVLEQVHTVETSRDRWLPAVAATWNAAPRQIVYRVRYTEHAGPRRVEIPKGKDARRTIDDPESLVSTGDKAIASHMLGVLEAWGLTADIHVLLHASSLGYMTDVRTCSIFLGPWGIETRQCVGADGDAEAFRASLQTMLGTYLRLRDYGGAIKATPHVLAQIKRSTTDPTFYPVLATTMGPHPQPQGSMMARSFAWGFPLALFVLFIGVWLHLLLAPVRPSSSSSSGSTSSSTASASSSGWRKERRSLQPQL